MTPADPSKPANSVTGIIQDHALRRRMIEQGVLVPREEDLPWHTNYKRAYLIQRERRNLEKTEQAR